MYTLQLSRKNFNDFVQSGNLPYILKYLDIIAVFKKIDKTEKNNFRPISTWSNSSTIFEKLIFTQINSSFLKPAKPQPTFL